MQLLDECGYEMEFGVTVRTMPNGQDFQYCFGNN